MYLDLSIHRRHSTISTTSFSRVWTWFGQARASFSLFLPICIRPLALCRPPTTHHSHQNTLYIDLDLLSNSTTVLFFLKLLSVYTKSLSITTTLKNNQEKSLRFRTQQPTSPFDSTSQKDLQDPHSLSFPTLFLQNKTNITMVSLSASSVVPIGWDADLVCLMCVSSVLRRRIRFVFTSSSKIWKESSQLTCSHLLSLCRRWWWWIRWRRRWRYVVKLDLILHDM